MNRRFLRFTKRLPRLMRLQSFEGNLKQAWSWGDAKQQLFEKIDAELAPFRERYNELMANPKELEEILQHGADKARRHSRKQLDKARRAIGIKPLAKLKK